MVGCEAVREVGVREVGQWGSHSGPHSGDLSDLTTHWRIEHMEKSRVGDRRGCIATVLELTAPGFFSRLIGRRRRHRRIFLKGHREEWWIIQRQKTPQLASVALCEFLRDHESRVILEEWRR